MLKWNNEDWMMNNNTTIPPRVLITSGKQQGKTKPRENTGRLPGHIHHEPIFVADPNHRRKLLMNDLYKLAKLPIDKRFTMTKMDATRIEKNFSYCIRQLAKQQDLSDEEYVRAGQAVLNHHFDCHDYCGNWCRRKDLSDADRLLAANKRFYRCKTKDAALFGALEPIVARFVTLQRLHEVAHGLDTQVNESFNNTFSWVAPKNKVYSGSQSLRNRLSIAIGINGLGTVDYFTRLYKSLGVIMTPNVHHFLQLKEQTRVKRIQKVKLVESKKLRRKAKFDKQRQDEAVATKERVKRDGTYQTAQNMQDDDADADVGNADETVPRNNGKPPNVCPFCKRKGHKTPRSKKCLHHVPEGAAPAAVPPQAEPAAAALVDDEADVEDEIDTMYCRPITEDTPSDEDMSCEEFQDCQTWSDDEDDDVVP
jgi:hypothetical protein